MTREEAIAYGKRVIDLGLNDETQAFCEMAIEALEQEPCDDSISRQAAINAMIKIEQDDIEQYGCAIPEGFNSDPAVEALENLPSVTPQPKTGHCKDCKWWKDSDGLYRRGGHAESQCPINRREVFEGNGYCFMYAPQEREAEEFDNLDSMLEELWNAE